MIKKKNYMIFFHQVDLMNMYSCIKGNFFFLYKKFEINCIFLRI
jgi:hypothetical protein